MRCKPRTLLPVTTFMCITLILMNACSAGTTGSGTVTDTAAQTQSATTDSDAADDIAAQTVSDGENTRHITILATSDMHANVMSYSYEDNTETEKDGMARLYTYIKQEREKNPDLILVDAGDAIQGTIMTDDICNKTPDEPHPVMAAMNYMKYDAMTVGNHEFNWGVPALLKILEQAEFPVLSANVTTKEGNYLTGCGWTIIDRGGVKLAVIGVCTPDVPVWDAGKEGIKDLTYEPASAGVAKAIREIGDQADLIMVCAHMGMQAEFDEEGGSDSARKILEDNPEVDILQVAHMHITVNERVGDVPVGGVRNSGAEICNFEITLDEDGNVTDSSVEIVPMEGIEPSEEIRELPVVKVAHNKTLNFINRGTTDGDSGDKKPLGTTTAKFQPDNEIRGIPEGKLRDSALIDFINKVQMEAAHTDVSVCSLFKDTSDLPEGDIYYSNVFDIYKYTNTVYRVTVTGAELKAYMELSAECYNQWKPGDINISFDPDYPKHLCDIFSGVDYEINLSKPKGERIENVMFHDEPLADDQTLTLAVSNYRYSSTLKMSGLVKENHDWESSNSVRDLIVEYFAEHSPVEPTVDNNWRITGVDLSEDDPRRAEIIGWINEEKLEVPYNESYNLADYEELKALAEGK